MTRITQQQLESYLWGAAVLLRGTIDAGDYKQFIFPLLFYKRLCDVFDEETLTALRDSGGDQDFALFPETTVFRSLPMPIGAKSGRSAGRWGAIFRGPCGQSKPPTLKSSTAFSGTPSGPTKTVFRTPCCAI